MLAHGLSVGAGELRPQSADTVIQLLNLGFTQNGSRRLCLQAVDKGREEVDVLGFDRGKFVVVLGQGEVLSR